MRHLVPLLAAGASILIAGSAQADLGDQLAKLLANDGAEGDLFGNSVAISGAIAIVGAYADDDNGDSSGSAYLFDTTTGVQIAKLLPDDGEEHDSFGTSVAISGAAAIVGAWANGDNGFQSGSAYLFSITTGCQIAKLLPKDGALFDWFGYSVAISDTTAIVGAHGDGDNGFNSGSVYLFDVGTGRQLAKLLPNDGAVFAEFGYSVALSGTTAIVGAPHDVGNGSGLGAAYLFDTTTGKQIAKLLADDGAAFYFIGHSVAISNTTAIVGAQLKDDCGDFSGAAYLFDTTNGQQIAKLLPDDGPDFDFFGESVGISPDSIGTAIVGAWADDDNGTWSGSAYLFDTVTGRQIAKILPSDGEAYDNFGISVAISGTSGDEIAIVGAYFDDDNGDGSGSAYLFNAAGAPGTCPWDVNGDGVVDRHDLVEVVHNLGLCDDPDNCPWDVNGDGIVNGRDVAAVARHFGACP